MLDDHNGRYRLVLQQVALSEFRRCKLIAFFEIYEIISMLLDHLKRRFTPSILTHRIHPSAEYNRRRLLPIP